MRSCRKRGHSLLEMILAALIFSTVAVGVLAVWTMQHKAVTKSGAVLVAQYFGEELMEECLAARYEGVPQLDTGGTPRELDVIETNKGIARTITYSATIDVSDIQVQAGINDTRLVVVTINWEGNDGVSQIEFRTYLQEKG